MNYRAEAEKAYKNGKYDKSIAASLLELIGPTENHIEVSNEDLYNYQGQW